MVKMEISGVFTSSPQSTYPQVVLKQIDANNYLPIVIGRFEAAAISMAQNRDKPVRPISYDLVQQILIGIDARVCKVEITDLHESTYYASVYVEIGDGTKHVFDARPSDAIALAVRFEAPIFAAPEILEDVSILPMQDHPVEQSEDKTEESSDLSVKETNVRETLNLIVGESEFDKLNRRLNQAIAEEAYEEAARLRDQLIKLRST